MCSPVTDAWLKLAPPIPADRHEILVQEPGGDDVSTADAAAVLGPIAHRHLLSADKYVFLAPGDLAEDSSGQRLRDRFAAGDICWLKRVVKSFRASLGYSDAERGQMFALLTGCLHLGNVVSLRHFPPHHSLALVHNAVRVRWRFRLANGSQRFAETDDGGCQVEGGTADQIEVVAECFGMADVAKLSKELCIERTLMG